MSLRRHRADRRARKCRIRSRAAVLRAARCAGNRDGQRADGGQHASEGRCVLENEPSGDGRGAAGRCRLPGKAPILVATATALALQHGMIPPTVNYTEADPDCDLDYVPNVARPKALGAALSNSFAFGGLNAVLVLRRAQG